MMKNQGKIGTPSRTGYLHGARLVALLRQRAAYLLDASIAVVMLAITLSVLTEDARAFDALGLVLAALASFPLVARRGAPLGVLVLIGAASVALVWLGYVDGSAPGLLVAFYSLALRPAARVRTWLTGATVAGLLLLHMVALSEATAAGYPGAPFFALFWAAAWVVGGRVRQRREGMAQLEQRAPRDEYEAETSAS
jgi:hypothetical protein